MAEGRVIASPRTRLGRFGVERRLGEGAMGVVYLAHDGDLDRQVAIKLLKPSRAGLAARARFSREAKALARLRHPNVVAVFERGSEGGHEFVAMEYVEGGTLRQWWTARRRSPPELVEKFVHAAHGLAAAHEAGIIHRDFKPDNVLVGRDGRAQVADFGLSASHEDFAAAGMPTISSDATGLTHAAGATGLTRTGAAVGTPAYMAPEVMTGSPANEASDQFSFFVSLFEAVYGRRPFVASTPAELADAIERGCVAVPKQARGVPGWLRHVIRRGLRARPEKRWPNMRAVAHALTRQHRWGLTALLVASVTAASATATVVASDMVTDPCAPAEDAASATWSDERARALQAAITTSGFPEAETVAANVTQQLDGYARRFTHASREACEASRVRGEQSAATYDLRLRCLQRRRVELDEFIAVLQRGGRGAVGAAPRNAGRLVPVEYCADVNALADVRPPPEDPTLRHGLAEAERRIARLSALLRSGQVDAAREQHTAVEAIANELDYAPLSASAHMASAVFDSLDGDPKAALASYRRAFALAQRGGDTRLAAGIAVLAISAAAGPMRDLDEARRWQWLAEPLVDRYRGDAPLRAAFQMGIGTIEAVGGHHVEALAAWTRARDSFRHAVGDDDPRLVDPMQNIASSLRKLGRADEALAILREADRITVTAYGEMTPERATILNKLGLTYAELGRLDAAEASYELSLRLHDLRGTAPSPRGGHPLNNLGTIYARRNDHSAAIERFDRALARWRPVYGDDHPFVADALGQRGLSELALGRSEAGEASLSAAVAMFEARGRPPPLEFSGALERIDAAAD